MKGAPEIVLSKCKTVETSEGEKPVSQYTQQIEEQLLTYQNQAMRTLGFAYKIINEDNNLPIPELADTGLIFLGFVAISDPVREDVPAAVAECLNAGIQVKIVTGDTTATAREIARQIGIWKPEDTDENIITGTDFEALPDNEAFERVKKLKVMCRARPTDKQRLVELLQKDGQIVAVTGDGTNDAPALAQANVGVAMNSGTQAAKEAGNMVDLDNDPTKLIEIVEIGKQLLMTRGTLTTFSIANDVAKYFAIVPALFMVAIPELGALNIMNLHSPESAILSAVIFNAIIIPILIPLALKGVQYKPIGASALLRRNLLIYGLGGVIVPFVGIKLIDLVVSLFF